MWTWLIVIVVIVAVVLFVLLAGNILYRLALDASFDKEFLSGPFVMDKRWRKYEEIFLTFNPQDTFIQNKDGLALHAVEAVRDPDQWVILVHGFWGRNIEMVDLADDMLKHDYSVLMPNHRAHSKSEGQVITMGIKESQDLVEWIDYLVKEHPNCSIYLLGISMGAATVMLTCGKKLPDNVKAAVEDCGYTSAWDEFAYQLKHMFHLPVFPFLHSANLATRIYGKYRIKDANALAAVKRSKIPILFIHGNADEFVPTHMVYKLYSMANYPKELLIIEGGQHALARYADRKAYMDAVLAWFERFGCNPAEKYEIK